MPETLNTDGRPIVVGIDGSTGAHRALAWAAAEARLRGCRLDVIAAWSLPVQWAQGYNVEWAVDSAALAEQADARAHEMLAEVVGDGDLPDWVNIVVIEGAAAQILVKASATAEMIVVGTRGLGGISRMLLGSVSNEVVHHAACPVVVVPAPRAD